jgi:pyridinium-3,5-biscarboxylic acid mononucleotide synthase
MFRELAQHKFQNGTIDYHVQARIVSMKAHAARAEKAKANNSRVVIATAGTTDIAVAEEAAVTLEAAGCSVDRIFDVGVAGLHRIINALPILRHPAVGCVIVCAGMDGALPSVVGGLVGVPVIAVPTSVGYGASFGGVSALLTM